MCDDWLFKGPNWLFVDDFEDFVCSSLIFWFDLFGGGDTMGFSLKFEAHRSHNWLSFLFSGFLAF